MPKLKNSREVCVFKTPFIEEFQRWLMYELHNSHRWNPHMVKITPGYHRWKATCVIPVTKKISWTIEFDGTRIIVTSQEPKVNIRKGLEINMGNGEIRIEETVA